MGILNVKWEGSKLKQDASNRLTSDTEKTSWNGKASGSHNHDSLYSKLNHTHLYLPLSGGTLTGKITFNKIGECYIYGGDSDAAPEVGGGLGNLVISSWNGISFTTSCAGQAYTNKTAVSIDCRNGIVKAKQFSGKASAAGTADSAVKLDTATAGSATQPVYFTGGKPAACIYTLGKSVPSDAKFTDTWRGIQNNLTSTATDQSLSAAQGKVLNDTINSIEVGGRNLIKGSHATEFTVTYPSSGYVDKDPGEVTTVLDSDTYTLSFWAKSTVDKDKIRIHFYSPSNITSVKGSQGQISSASDGQCDFTLSTIWQQYWVTYKIPKGGNSKRSIIIPRIGPGAGVNGKGTISIKWEKLEKGNKASDWTPAPEDFDVKLSGKANSSHTHTKSQITDFPSSLPASDVYSWAKASSKPSYSWSEIGSKPSTFTPSSHTHTKSQITDFPSSLPANGGTSSESYKLYCNPTENKSTNGLFMFQYSGNTTFCPDSNWWSVLRCQHPGYTAGYWQELAFSFGSDSIMYRRNANGSKSSWKALAWQGHTHAIADITNLQNTLNNKAAYNHNHDSSYIKSSGSNVAVHGSFFYVNTFPNVYSTLYQENDADVTNNRAVIWYNYEYQGSLKYEDYCDHYLNIGSPNSGNTDASFGVLAAIRFRAAYASGWIALRGQSNISKTYSVYLPLNAGTLQVSSSDVKLKYNIQDTEVNGLDFINKIKLHQFDWKTDNTHQSIGFIADELEELDERLSVGGNSDRVDKDGLPIDPKCVNTFYLQGYEVKAIQELSSLVKDLINKVNALKEENKELKSLIK